MRKKAGVISIAPLVATAPAAISAASPVTTATAVAAGKRKRGRSAGIVGRGRRRTAAEPGEQAEAVTAGGDAGSVGCGGVRIGPAVVACPVRPDHQHEEDGRGDADGDEESRDAAHARFLPRFAGRAEARARCIGRRIQGARSLIIRAEYGTVSQTECRCTGKVNP